MNRRFSLELILVVSVGIAINLSCRDRNCTPEIRFTSEELGWIYYLPEDSLKKLNPGQDESVYDNSYEYQLRYLLNGTDTIVVDVEAARDRYYWSERYCSMDSYVFNGWVQIEFRDHTDFISRTTARINKTNGSFGLRELSIWAKNFHDTSAHLYYSREGLTGYSILPSVSVLGIDYANVYSFENYDGYRKILFAENYGFISIERENGNKVELISDY